MALSLHWADYLVFSLFLVASLGIGIYHALTGGRQRTTAEFLLANRRLRVLPTMLSLLVSFQSAIMILGHTAEMYTRGIQAWLMMLIGFTLAILCTERLFCPWMYPLKLISVFQYLELRFESKAVRITGAALGTLSGILYMGVAMFAPSIALQAATGFPVAASIPLMAVVATTYTAVGGMRAVIWTDVFQFVVMISGMIAILVKGNILVGGFGNVIEQCESEGRLNWADVSFDPRVRHTVWGLTIGWAVNWLYTYGVSQPSIQRYAATQTERESRLILLWNIPPLIIMVSIACMIGLTALAYYSMIQCDPLASGQIKSPNQILALFVVTMFSDIKGFSGLFLATLYSGALSTVSSTLTASAAIIWMDVFKWKLDARLSEYQAALFNKFLVVISGVLATVVAFMAVKIPGPITQVAIMFSGAVGGPTLGLFLLGGLFRKAEWKGALTGVLVSFIVLNWMSIGNQNLKGHQRPLPPVSIDKCTEAPSADFNFTTKYAIPHDSTQEQSEAYLLFTTSVPPEHTLSGLENLYAVSYIWYSLLGVSITIIVGMTVSLITNILSKAAPRDIPEEYFIPLKKALLFSLDGESKSTKTINLDSGNKDGYSAREVRKQEDPLLSKENTTMGLSTEESNSAV